MAEGRTTLLNPSRMAAPSTGGNNMRGRANIGTFNELYFGEGAEVKVILVDGNYQNRFVDETDGLLKTVREPFFRYMRHSLPPIFQTPACRKAHTNKTTDKVRWANLPCSAGPDQSKPCRICNLGSQQVAPRARKVFTCIHIHPYHMIASKMPNRPPYPKLCIMPEEQECKMCEENLPLVQVARRYIEFTIPDYEILVNHNKRLRNKCVCGGQLGTLEFRCSECGRPLLKYAPDVKEEFRKVTETGKYYCQSCSKTVEVAELKACSQKCDNPEAQSVFNTVLTIQKVRTQQKQRSFTQINIPETAAAGTLLTEYADLMQPLDLAATFAPDMALQRMWVADGSANEPESEARVGSR